MEANDSKEAAGFVDSVSAYHRRKDVKESSFAQTGEATSVSTLTSSEVSVPIEESGRCQGFKGIRQPCIHACMHTSSMAGHCLPRASLRGRRG